jgi:hypothetical protein
VILDLELEGVNMGEIKVIIKKKGSCQRKLLFKDFHRSLPIFRRASHVNSILGVAEGTKTFSACWQSLARGCRCGVWWSNHSDLGSRAKTGDIGGGDHAESKQLHRLSNETDGWPDLY